MERARGKLNQCKFEKHGAEEGQLFACGLLELVRRHCCDGSFKGQGFENQRNERE